MTISLPAFLFHPLLLWSIVGLLVVVVWFYLGRRALLNYLMSDQAARPSVEFLMFLLCGPFGWHMIVRFLRFHLTTRAMAKKTNPTPKP